MAIEENFTEEELESQIRLCFDYDNMHDFNFKTIFAQMEETEDEQYYLLRLRGKKILIDKITGGVWEI